MKEIDLKKLKKKIQKRKKKQTPIISQQKDLQFINLLSNNNNQNLVQNKPQEINEEFKKIFENHNSKQQIQYESDEEIKQESIKQKNEQVDEQKQQSKNLTKKQKKQKKIQLIAQLKVLVPRPDLVEDYDVNSKYPFFLNYLKGYKNTVEVPKNWEHKKKQFYFKKGLYKKMYKLPKYIEETGITKLRDPLSEKNTIRMIRMKMKERMNPKMGKIDIDYEVLHDAFFKNQQKPEISKFGDIYYEGREEEQKLRKFKPGKISRQLREALGLNENDIPPWIYNMQKFGPPPSYPNFKYKGMNNFLIKKNENEIKRIEYFDKNFIWGKMKEEQNIEENINTKEILEQNEFMKIKTFGYEDNQIQQIKQIFNFLLNYQKIKNQLQFQMKVFKIIFLSLLISITCEKLLKKSFHVTKKALKKRRQPRDLMVVPNNQLLQNKSKQKKTMKNRVAKKIKDKAKKQSFRVTRAQINKISHKKIQQERKLQQQKDRKLEGEAAEEKIDSMPLLLFGDYDIVIEKQ